MSADNIIKRILDDSRQECAQIEADAKKRAAETLEQAKADAQKSVAAIEAKGATDCEEARRRRMQIAELDSRKLTLSAKRDVLDEAFARAMEQLAALTQADWEALMLRRIREGAQSGREQLVVRAEDKKRFEKLLHDANKALKADGKAGELSIADQAGDFAGGFVLTGEELELSSTYEVMLREVREAAEGEIAAMLFASEG